MIIDDDDVKIIDQPKRNNSPKAKKPEVRASAEKMIEEKSDKKVDNGKMVNEVNKVECKKEEERKEEKSKENAETNKGSGKNE